MRFSRARTSSAVFRGSRNGGGNAIMLAVRIVLALALAALLMLMATAFRLFHDAFLRKRTLGNPDYDPFEDNIPREHMGRFRAGRAWITSPKRDLTTLHVQSGDGLRLTGYLLPAGDCDKFIVLLHGYHSTSLHDFGLAAMFYHRMGYSLLCTDLRAHGNSEGRVISFGLRERHDVKIWVEALAERYGPDIRVYLHGLSMGASTALMSSGLDLPRCVRGIIADCAFTSPSDIVRYLLNHNYRLRFPPLCWALSLILRVTTGCWLDSYSTLDAMAKCDIPVMFVHGGADEFVPTHMSEQNYAACAAEKRLLIVPGAAHAVSYLVDPYGYIRELTEFLSR